VNLRLDRDKPVPLARQIRAHVERLIRERLLAPGVKLPATRELARELGVNRATVAVAYEELVAAGLARARVGQGTFVADTADGRHSSGRLLGIVGPPPPNGGPRAAAPGPASSRTPPVSPTPAARTIDWSALYSKSARIVGDDDGYRAVVGREAGAGVISFAGGMPDSGLFPTDAFRRVLNQVVRDDGEALLQYYPAAGYPPLRRFLSSYLLRFGVEAPADEILIVNGAQQGFDLITRTFIDARDFVAIEEPTYPRATQVVRSFGAELLAVPWDGEGPRVDVFERALERHRPKLFYCQPCGHNPTGLTIGAARARALLAASARYEVPIVEDGFDGSLDYGRRPAAPLKAIDRDGLVISIGTFSKILFPGLRLGWIVAPPPVIERLLAAKELADLHTSALIQAAVHRFCAMRLLERHVAKAATEYGRRRALLLASLRRRMPDGVTWTEPMGGFSLLLTLPRDLDATTLLARARPRGTAFTPGTAFFVNGGGERTLRLSFSSVPATRIDEGVRRLAESIKSQARRGRRRAIEEAAVPLV
jgi:2-aminoadipate transaminase